VRKAVSKIRGAFSAAVMSGDALVGFRDPYGVRPLCLGDYEGHPVISSETAGLDIIGADFVREIQPGEIVIADQRHGLRSERVELEGAPALCIFEFIYCPAGLRWPAHSARRPPGDGPVSSLEAPSRLTSSSRS
jgi:amidophosphoribosyltransferase